MLYPSVKYDTFRGLSLCSFASLATTLVPHENVETLPRNLSFSTHSMLSVPISVIIAVPSATVLASRCPTVFGLFSSSYVHQSSSSGCSPRCASSSPSFCDAGRMFWVGCVTGAASSRNLNLRYQLFSRHSVDRRHASRMTTLIGTDIIFPVTALPCLLMSF